MGRVCFVCYKSSFDVKLLQCSRCKTRFYCGRDCQAKDWKTHKADCGQLVPFTPDGANSSSGSKWFDKYRKCRDGNSHEGDLELITWDCPKEGTGWGGVFKEESADLKHRFDTQMKGDLEKLYKKWSNAFRWTCCGTSAGMDYGCDHHGSGSAPCSCDFCRMGKPLTDKIYREQSKERMGLNLRRGPDPRSYHPGLAAIAATGRSVFGLDR